MNRVYPEAIALAPRVRPAELASATYPLASADAAMAHAARRIGHKTIVAPSHDGLAAPPPGA